jgi:hypothetical protein
MRRPAARIAVLALLLAFGGLGAGCTILNSYGDVEPEKIEGGGNDATMMIDTGSNDATADVTDGGSSMPEAQVEAGPRGVIVMGGTAVNDGGESFVLTALDPSTGSELPHAREKMTVSAVEYDGIRDIWYIFESGGAGIYALPTDSFYVHTRKIDRTTGAWTELGKASIPPALAFQTTAVLKERVSYVAYGDGDAGDTDGGYPPAYTLVTLNTSNPTKVSLESTYPLWSGAPSAVVGTWQDTSQLGGKATLGASVKGQTQLTPVDVSMSMPNALLPASGAVSVGAIVGYGRRTQGTAMYVMVVSKSFGAGPAAISLFDPVNADTLSMLGFFPFGDGNVKPPAFSDCAQTAFVVGTSGDLNVYAVSLAGIAMASDIVDAASGTPVLTSTSAPTGHSGQGVYFEPYTNTVITPFSQGGNFALTAFTLGGTPTSPTLVQRQAPRWVPPADVRPNFIGTAIPFPAVCPTLGDQ